METTNQSQNTKLCPDSEGLGYWTAGKLAVGYVSEVNGPGSAEVPEFVPTRHELIQLATHWSTVHIDDQSFHFLYGRSGWSDSNHRRRLVFAARRIRRIATLLGDEQIRKTIQQAEEEFGRTADPRAGHIQERHLAGARSVSGGDSGQNLRKPDGYSSAFRLLAHVGVALHPAPAARTGCGRGSKPESTALISTPVGLYSRP